MTRPFTCRGFEGQYFQLAGGWWHAAIEVSDVWFVASGPTPSAAKSRVRRKLDAVERAFRERGKR